MLLSLALVALQGDAPSPSHAPLAIKASKALTCAQEGTRVIDRAVCLVRDGMIERIGRASEVEIPDGYEVVDVGERWIMPGLIDLHSHVGAGAQGGLSNDFTDNVYLANPGFRISSAAIPGNPLLRMGLAGGVTTVLFIPGSISNMGGFGVLMKTGFDDWESSLVRDPGSLKVAQSGNPERWTTGVSRTFMNWNTRVTLKKGIAYAEAWERFEAGEGPEPDVDAQWDYFRQLVAKETQISVHTQVYQVVLMTLTMLRAELGFDIYLDHGTVGGQKLGALAQELGVPAIAGPRTFDTPATSHRFAAGNTEPGFYPVHSAYRANGLELVGFNTDSPIVPQEELSVQAAVGARYGLDDTDMSVLRGVTIIPAIAAGIDDRLGSLEAGKEADILVVTGHIADPRHFVERVFLSGRSVYDISEDKRLW